MGRGTPALVLFLSLVVAVASLLANQRLPPVGVDYHPDEGVWTAIGKYYFQKAFIDRDLSYESWDIAYSSFGRRNPTLGKYLIGGSLFAHGVVDADTEFPGYEPGFTWAQVEKLRPSPEILSAARAPMAWLGMGSAVLLFLLARELFRSWFIGLAAALAFSCRPLILEASRQVMMEMPTTFLSLAALYLAARWVMREPDDRASSQRESFVAIGAVCGLAFATKLNSLLVPITIGTWLLYVWAQT